MSSTPAPLPTNPPQPRPIYDNFYSPENHSFYSQTPYKPLDPSAHQIRLLRLLPRSEDGLLSFTLLDNSVLGNEKYTALSYCAGDPKRTTPVYVNGIKFNAFANLAGAFEEVEIYWEKEGVKGETRWLWADQICINQSNFDERSHQVGLMRDIYKGAECVLICLTGQERNTAGMEWAIAAGQLMRGHESFLSCESYNYNCRSTLRAYCESSLVELKSFQNGLFPFCRLMRHPWWTRAWICQEFLYAVDAVFLHGGLSLAFNGFASVVHHFVLAWTNSETIDSKFGNVWAKTAAHDQNRSPYSDFLQVEDLMARKLKWTTPGDLKGWLSYGHRSCNASDPRDKIFAFLGLASKGYDITPDYTSNLSLEALFTHVARKIIEFEGNVNVLLYTSRHGTINVLPSWVPDWSSMTYTMASVSYTPADLHPKLPPQALPKIIQGSVLRLSGIKIDILDSDRPQTPWSRTRKGLHIFEVSYSRKRLDSETLWYFPGIPILFNLSPENDYWRLVDIVELKLREDEIRWGALIIRDDWDSLLKMEGLEMEVIDIH